jgi:chemotaxis protein methyltransferase CheR
MTREEFRLLRDLISEHSGLWFEDEMMYLLQRRLAPRLEFHGLSDFGHYYRLLRYDPRQRGELETAVEALTTNETYFYREPHQLRAFAQEILPLLAKENAPKKELRIWCAGCATGEEVYTVAVLLVQSGLFEGWKVEVQGSDIARRVLTVARGGIYGAHAFRTPESELVRPFFRHEEGRWQAREAIRTLVSFSHLNLLDSRAARCVGVVDVIFCRNVMIYFHLEARRRVVRTFYERLREGGYLLLGHSESLLHVTTDFEIAQLRHDLVYRKPRTPA